MSLIFAYENTKVKQTEGRILMREYLLRTKYFKSANQKQIKR